MSRILRYAVKFLPQILRKLKGGGGRRGHRQAPRRY